MYIKVPPEEKADGAKDKERLTSTRHDASKIIPPVCLEQLIGLIDNSVSSHH
jgi:hypothetical protein